MEGMHGILGDRSVAVHCASNACDGDSSSNGETGTHSTARKMSTSDGNQNSRTGERTHHPRGYLLKRLRKGAEENVCPEGDALTVG
jgi:hypothetical protein